YGRQPQRERARILLDQDGDEPLHRPEQRPVDHDRPLAAAVLRDVLQLEPLRNLEVELERRALPLAAQRILDLEVDLRTVERAAALVDLEFLARLLQHAPQRRFGALPGRRLAHEALRPG